MLVRCRSLRCVSRALDCRPATRHPLLARSQAQAAGAGPADDDIVVREGEGWLGFAPPMLQRGHAAAAARGPGATPSAPPPRSLAAGRRTS